MTYAKLIKHFAIVGISAFSLLAITYAAGARINTTRSIPLGLYWLSSSPISVNSYVIFCPPDQPAFLEAKKRGYLTSGFCEGELGYMMKKILAAKGDAVSFNVDGVRVNGQLLPLSARYSQDKAGRAMPVPVPSTQVLNKNELLVMSDVNPKSFDSRYFGPVDIGQVKSTITPIFTW